MTSLTAFLAEITLVLSGLVLAPAYADITLVEANVEAYSANIAWTYEPPTNTSLIGYSVRFNIDGNTNANPEDIILNETVTTYTLTGLDDMRSYNACVMTRVSMGISEEDCLTFTTFIGSFTWLAIASGVFILLCLVTFAALDFIVSNKRRKEQQDKEGELLEKGWTTFKRNSKKDKKGKKKRAPERPRADSTSTTSDVRFSTAPSID